MNEAVQIFLKTIQERNHVLQLIDSMELEIQFSCGFQKQRILLKNGEASLSNHLPKAASFYDIKGEIEAIENLLEGKETLRTLMRRNQIAVSAPFRTLLLLESLFYLMKSHESFRKII